MLIAISKTLFKYKTRYANLDNELICDRNHYEIKSHSIFWPISSKIPSDTIAKIPSKIVK